MGTLSVFLIFIFLMLSSTSEINCFSDYNCTCKQHERKALLDFKDSLSIVPVTRRTNPLSWPIGEDSFRNWVGEDCCRNWDGVSCDNVTCNVVSLEIDSFVHRSKVVSPALFELKHLQFLSLWGIDFSGSRIPQSIGLLKNLTHLGLITCNFSGPIPQQLNNLTNLLYLTLDSSFQHGTKFDNLKWISDLQKIRVLYLTRLDLSQTPYDSLRVFHQFPSLNTLMCSECKLSNAHFSQFLSNSSFLSKGTLRTVDFSGNILHGPIPHVLVNLSSLNRLFLSDNFFSSSIPLFITTFYSLKNLDLGNNSFSGNIPSTLGRLRSLAYLDLSSNHLIGVIHNNVFGNLSNLKMLKLANNDIGGQLPKSLCNCPVLEVLWLQSNTISGTIPSCLGNVSNLYKIDLSSNTLSGIIPISLWKIFGLSILNLSKNRLQGELPKLNTYTLLRRVDLGENQLSGIIPQWTGENLGDLRILRLRSNNLFGSIPLQICSLDRDLQILDLADNHLTGVIPECFGNLGGMQRSPGFRTLGLPSIGIEEPIEETIKGEVLRYTTNIESMVNLDLSSNNMIGPIPPNLTNLQGLKNLNLSHNHLTGLIPSKIGQLRSLESLDLSHNCLSESIPQSMSALNSLEVLHLSYNNLSGPVPTGYQLQTLNDPANYVGNPDLCADFLPRKCTSNNLEKKPNHDQEKEHEDDAKREEMWLYVFILLGVATGFWGVIGILIVKKQWRYAYFHIADHIGDWLYVWTALMVTRLMRKIK